MEMSSDKVEGEERMVGRQAITLRTGDRGVSMIKKEMEGGESEYGLDGLGLMDGLGQEELAEGLCNHVGDGGA